MKIGSRVGAVQSADEKEVRFYGYGVYEGDFVLPENCGGLNFGLNFGIPNPRIKLDNGDYVYGCECWWGSEEKVKEMIAGRNVIVVKPDRSNSNESKGWCSLA